MNSLSSRAALRRTPATAVLVPYDAPSAISLNRQRNAVVAVRNGTTPGPDLRGVLNQPRRPMLSSCRGN